MKYIYKTLVTSALIFTAAAVFAEKAPVYISPNNDGVQDVLEVPIKITENRYVKEWSFIISNEFGNDVRTIGNKEKRPDVFTFKSFFKSLVTPKQGITIPASVTWNGILDDGTVAKDGVYYYRMTATDDNGNKQETKKFKVIVDNTAPEVKIKNLSDDEKNFGEGAKSHLKIQQDGSEEDLWIGQIFDASGNVVRAYQFKSSKPQTITWDGTADTGLPVQDGIYSYRINSTDRAGNKSDPAQITNIIYSAEKPATNITISGSKYFSPNGDGIKDLMTFNVSIPKPQSPVNSLIAWNVSIVDAKGKKYREFNGTDDAPSSIEFDGKDDNGNILPEGEYQASVSAKYKNGYESAVIKSPLFVLDNTCPTAVVRAGGKTFSPDGDGNLDIITITQSTSTEKQWLGQILDEKGQLVKSYEMGEAADSSIVWNGLDEKGKLASDGIYYYQLSSTDLAGNSVTVATDTFTLDTSTTELILTASLPAFSPNSDKVLDSITFTPIVKTQSGVVSYMLKIHNQDEDTVKTFEAKKSLPASFEWNGLSDEGTRCADGEYYATLETVSKNGSEAFTQTQKFIIDTVAPEISISIPYTIFSPDNDGNLDNMPFTITSSEETKWTGEIYSSEGSLRSYAWQGKVPSFVWDGTDENGNLAADGSYSIKISSVDAAGNKCEGKLENIVLDKREAKAYVTCELDGISPNGDDFLEEQKFNIHVTLADGMKAWKFEILDAEQNAVKAWTEKDSADLPSAIIWNGIKEDGTAGEGQYSSHLHIEYVKGNIVDASSSSFLCTATPPVLKIRTAPEYFSPDNDDENDDLYIQLKGSSLAELKNWSLTIKDPNNGKTFWSTSGKSTITERLIWDGRGNNGELVQSAMDYPYEFTATDELGMTSTVEGKIQVDVLVVRVGDVLKMQVPSIIFRGNNADFKNAEEVAAGPREDRINKGLEQDVIDNNLRVLKRIAEILNKFKDYTVTIEGHANNVSGTEEEETSTDNGNIPLVPLSQSRAEFVKQKLIENGVDSSRLTAIGLGGRQPVAAREDKDNWWKNRRVEFILNK